MTNCVSLDCPGCNGYGCDECKNGKFDLLECPIDYIDDDTYEMIELSKLYMENGQPPVIGGVYDQTYNFIKVAQFVYDEREYWKAQNGNFPK